MEKIRVLQFPISANNGVKSYALNNWKFFDKSKFQCDFAIVRSNLGKRIVLRKSTIRWRHGSEKNAEAGRGRAMFDLPSDMENTGYSRVSRQVLNLKKLKNLG